jgi:hypothetical protein
MAHETVSGQGALLGKVTFTYVELTPRRSLG